MREIQRADGTDDEARLERLLGPVAGLNGHLPARRRLIPVQRGDAGAEAAVRGQPVLLHDAFEVRAQLGLLAVVLAPMVDRLEGVAVLVAADVDARTGIAVLPPGAARAVVLVDDGERQPGLHETNPGEDA